MPTKSLNGISPSSNNATDIIAGTGIVIDGSNQISIDDTVVATDVQLSVTTGALATKAALAELTDSTAQLASQGSVDNLGFQVALTAKSMEPNTFTQTNTFGAQTNFMEDTQFWLDKDIVNTDGTVSVFDKLQALTGTDTSTLHSTTSTGTSIDAHLALLYTHSRP
ncbi:MAG TPA: hypothetical protein EYO58_08810 [Flavobacteriales bacterium]|nr:hypothetical protein [Flavobacteriales bacterium]